MALNPWPVPLGLWPLNEQFGTHVMKSTPGTNHITAHQAYLESGPPGSSSGSYKLKGNIDSYFEIDNSNYGASSLNSYTYTLWLYPTDE